MKLALLNLFLVPAAVIAKRTPFLAASSPRLLKLRGGGGDILGLSKDNFAAAAVTQHSINGGLGLPAPEALAQMYGAPAPAPNSVAEISWSFVGSTCVGLALMFYVSYFTDADIAKIAVSSAHPCLFVAWKLFLQKTWQKAGCKESTGPLVLVTFLPILLLLTGWGGFETDILVKITSGICMLFGVTGWLGGSDLAKNLWGCGTPTDGTNMSYKWMGRCNLLYGLALFLLNSGKSPAEVIGITSLAYVVQMIDFAFITKDRDETSQDEAVVPVLALFNGLICYALLQDNNGGGGGGAAE